MDVLSGTFLGGGQNLERSIIRNFKIANVKMTKDELFHSFIIEFIFVISYQLFEPKYLIMSSNCKALILQMTKF